MNSMEFQLSFFCLIKGCENFWLMGILQIIRFTRNVSQKKMLQLGVVRGSVDVEEQNPKLNQKIFTKFQML